MSGLHATPLGVEACYHAPRAELVEVCLFEADGEKRLSLQPRGDGYHTGRLGHLRPGQPYGLRVHGPWNPPEGLFCRPELLLVDPFARAIGGDFVDAASAHHDGPARDTAGHVPRSIFLPDPSPPRPGPRVPWSETVVYETHVRNLTIRHPDVAPELRGTYRGAAAPAVVDHLQAMGITTVELMPVAHYVTEPFLQRRGLRNRWGYSTLGWFAPHGGYATSDDGSQLAEFVAMVDAFHAAGLEVIVDVVFNHTAEGGLDGPILSYKGLDASVWYRHRPGEGFVDWTGTGNTVDTSSPLVRQEILAALRWWHEMLGVDGFRFDLAVTLGRAGHEFDPTHLSWLTDDPGLSGCKLIAEPWDLGPHGYRLGHFGGTWREWNGRFRDDVRDYWRGRSDDRVFALRLSGSPDLFEARSPGASVNFVTAHDGFTLADLVSYDHKHNEPNLEANHDGHDDNRSWNSGHEGPTDDPAIREVRRLRARAMLSTVLLAAGVPMLSGGDELGVTHAGNNNAYPLDEPNWYRWDETAHTDLVGALTRLRRDHTALREGQFRSLDHDILEGRLGGERLLIVTNPSGEEASRPLPTGSWTVAFDSSGGEGGPVEGQVPVPPWTVLVCLPSQPMTSPLAIATTPPADTV